MKNKNNFKTMFLALFSSFSLFSCGGKTGNPVSSPSENPSDDFNRPVDESANMLVTYFSVPDDVSNSYVEIDGRRLGNTQYMAYVIQENTGGNIFRILPKVPYPTNHSDLLKVAQEERRSNARPEIQDSIEDFEKYDIVFVGYPNWNADLPNIMYTFFDTYDFSGKTIVPFNTHGGSGFSSTRETIAKLEPNATMQEGLSISRNAIQNDEKTIIDWLTRLGYTKTAE